ncbi:MAG: fimbrillin family protein [Bacteroidales bacterium]|nr:fimbrillin family protein [Bacteroidales bacterium]
MKKILLLLAAAALFAVSCNKEAAPVVPDEGAPVKFTAELKYQFDTRATSSAFEVGDEIGIFAGAPIARYNVKGTVATGGAVNLASAINWQAGQTAATTFAAYYPYSADYTPAQNSETPMVLSCSLPTAQNAGLGAADLHIAKVADVAVGTTVALPFKHAFTKISVTVTKEISAAVTKVEILDTKVAGSVDLVAQTVAVSGDAAAITAYANTSTYDAIILPQTVAPKIKVTVAGNTSYTFSLDGSAKDFEAGKVYAATVHIAKSAAQQNEATFSAGAITDWTSESFGTVTGPVVESGDVWSVIGTVNGHTAWDEDFVMTQVPATAVEGKPWVGTWEANVTIGTAPNNETGIGGDEFKLRWAGSWADDSSPVGDNNIISLGMPSGWWWYAVGGPWETGRTNIKIQQTGTFKITLVYNADHTSTISVANAS